MKINVGSENKVKIQAVKDSVKLYPELFPEAEVVGVDVDVEEFGHPKELKETMQGAIDRARAAFKDCDYSFGLEGGLMSVPFTKTGFMEIGACAIYDGQQFHLGLGPGYEWPSEVTQMIVEGKADASLAFKQLGLTKHEKLGAMQGGIIGYLTNGRLTREEFIKNSIIMAMIHLERAEMFR